MLTTTTTKKTGRGIIRIRQNSQKRNQADKSLNAKSSILHIDKIYPQR